MYQRVSLLGLFICHTLSKFDVTCCCNFHVLVWNSVYDVVCRRRKNTLIFVRSLSDLIKVLTNCRLSESMTYFGLHIHFIFYPGWPFHVKGLGKIQCYTYNSIQSCRQTAADDPDTVGTRQPIL